MSTDASGYTRRRTSLVMILLDLRHRMILLGVLELRTIIP
jgi:hypothetical protein